MKRLNRVRPGIVANWKLHYENAPSHSCFVLNVYLAWNVIATLLQSCYCPDVTPADFSYSHKLSKTPPWDSSRSQSGFDTVLEEHPGKKNYSVVSKCGQLVVRIELTSKCLILRNFSFVAIEKGA